MTHQEFTLFPSRRHICSPSYGLSASQVRDGQLGIVKCARPPVAELVVARESRVALSMCAKNKEMIRDLLDCTGWQGLTEAVGSTTAASGSACVAY